MCLAGEVARLQGFPEDFVISWEGQRSPNRLYHQLGNAVSPVTVALIAEEIAKTGALGYSVELSAKALA